MQPTWILVADGARARLFAPSEEDDALLQLEHFDHAEGRQKDRAPPRDRAPRTIESVGGARHVIEAHTSEDDKSSERFARELGEVLERGRTDHRYERLILAAPPHFLGTLKQVLNKQVRACVVAQVDKDLTALPLEEIRERMATTLAG
jgi:protein required for attachment to host cells